METSGVRGGVFSGIGSGMLGLEMPLHPQQQQQPRNPQGPQSLHLLQNNPQMVGFSTDHSLQQQQQQQSLKQGYPFGGGSKTKQASPLSDEDEHGFNTADDGSAADANRKISPWQRMKWTDNMVRLLIMAVYYIGDEGGSEGNGSDPIGKKKGGGLLQKKGKWKSVSRAMMEKGFYVSPQQCEDKFNDLNKRYKRVNDILGRGTACKVVENQSLLETMDLSPKMKEEVKKLLNSKHLFFREMCAYHNSCGHGGAMAGAASCANQSPEVATEVSQIQHQQAQQQQHCFPSSENAQSASNSGRIEMEASKLGKVGSENNDEEEDDDEVDEEDDDDDDEEAADGHARSRNGHGKEDDEDNYNKPSDKRSRKGEYMMSPSPLMQQLSGEVTNMIQDGLKSSWEKKHWMKMRLLQLEEQQVRYQYEAFQLEKQRLKWVKFSGKKEREMERAKLKNERRRLENERMVLLVRQKDLELVDLQQHHHLPQPQSQEHACNKRRDPSNITGSI